jgi:hypothetical protein
MTVVDALPRELPRRLRRRARLVGFQMERVDDHARNPELGLDLDQPEHLAELYERLGHSAHDEQVRELVRRAIRPVAGGMPTGSGGLAFQHNLPAPGTFTEDSDAFFRNTERNDIPQQSVAYPGLGGGHVDNRILNVGVLAGLRLVAKLTLTVAGAGTCTSTYQWPWNALKKVGLNVNGQTGIISAEGMDLRARRQRVYRNPREEIVAAPATDVGTTGLAGVGNPVPGVIANGTYNCVLIYDLPITHDDYNLVGALYAQSDQNTFTWFFEAAGAADLFTLAGGSTATLTGTIFPTITVYDIPTGDTQQGRQVLLPNMAWLHGFLSSNQPFANQGDVPVSLIRTAGQLLATYTYIDNGGAAQIDPLAVTELRFQYGGNRRPRVFNPPEQLIEKNVHDYNGKIKPGYLVLDNEVDNPVRDLVYPKGVTELQVVAVIPNTITVNGNAHAHYVEDTMFPGR